MAHLLSYPFSSLSEKFIPKALRGISTKRRELQWTLLFSVWIPLQSQFPTNRSLFLFFQAYHPSSFDAQNLLWCTIQSLFYFLVLDTFTPPQKKILISFLISFIYMANFLITSLYTPLAFSSHLLLKTILFWGETRKKQINK